MTAADVEQLLMMIGTFSTAVMFGLGVLAGMHR